MFTDLHGPITHGNPRLHGAGDAAVPRERRYALLSPPYTSELSFANWQRGTPMADLITSSSRVGGEIATSLQNISRCLADLRSLASW